MTTYTYELSKAQSTIASCNTRFRVVNAGRRFGKTWLSGAEIMKSATSEEAKRKGDYVIWYIAPTNEQARNLMWDTWLKKHVPPEYIAYKNEARMVMRLKNGSSICLFSAENPDHLVGSYIDMLIMDECALISKDVFEKIRPSLSDRQGKGMFISTPRGFNWFHNLFIKEIGDPEWKSFEYTTMDGGNVPDKEIEQAKKDMSAKMFAQEYLASFECMSNRIYDSFDKHLNCIEILDPTWGLSDIHIGMDFNVNPMTATISVIEHDKKLGDIAYTFDEIYEPNSNTQWICDEIKRRYPQADKSSGIYIYPDPTGRKRQTSAAVGKTDFSILENAGFHVMSPYAPYSTRDKFNTSNNVFCNAAGDRKNFIYRQKCPHLCTALEGYSYKENGDPDKSGGLDHISDAHSYFLNYKFPINGQGRLYRPEVLGV